MRTPTITIITPCFNEVDSIEKCVNAVRDVMSNELPGTPYEHIISDNASIDGTFSKLIEISKKDINVRVLLNSRNIGPILNIWSGLKYAKGKYIVPFLPADLQDPADKIPEFYKILKENPKADVVFGIRTNRQEKIILKFSRNIYYKIIYKFGGTNFPEHAGEFLMAKRNNIERILATNQTNPYIRGLIAQSASFPLTLHYEWQIRKQGKSKNNYWSLIDEAINGFVSTSKIPARIGILAGFLMSALGIVLALINFVENLFGNTGASKGIPTIIVGLFLFSGLQLAFLGLIGEYILSIHNQIKRLPEHSVTEL